MNEINYKEASWVFAGYDEDLPSHSPGKLTIEPMAGGLINHSYRVNCELKPSFLLQQINKHVFTKPEDVQRNYMEIWQYAEFEFTGLHLPAPLFFERGKTLYIDKNANYWRAFQFVDNARSHNIATKPAQAKATAKAFAKFTAAFEDFNVALLKIVIPNFHDLSFRYHQFQEALQGEQYERMAKALPLIEKLKKRERYKYFFEEITASGEFPLRVMHHDAKISNVLFNPSTGKVICLVDFDTVMPGYYFSDLGDMIRSMACSHDENSTDFEHLSIRKIYYMAIIDGYRAVMDKYFTEAEKKYIHYAGIMMIYMQSLRFLGDYLNKDIYYKVADPEQNYNRALNQLLLLEKLEELLEKEYQFKA